MLQVLTGVSWLWRIAAGRGGYHGHAPRLVGDASQQRRPRHRSRQGIFGDRVFAAVLDAGESESGASVHLVDTEYDIGESLSPRTSVRA